MRQKRFGALILALCMTLTCLPSAVFASSEELPEPAAEEVTAEEFADETEYEDPSAGDLVSGTEEDFASPEEVDEDNGSDAGDAFADEGTDADASAGMQVFYPEGAAVESTPEWQEPAEESDPGEASEPEMRSAAEAEEEKILYLDTEEVIQIEGGIVYYSFTPDHSGDYMLYSYDKTEGDSCAYLYDGNWEELASDDDSAGDGNFRLVCELEAGKQYYYGIREFNDGVLSCRVLLTEVVMCTVTFYSNDENAWFNIWDDESGELEKQYVYTEYLPAGFSFYYQQPETDDETMIFQGWSVDPAATEPEDIEVTGDMELYAVWGKACTVTFHANHENALFEYWDDEAGEYVSRDTFSYQYATGESFYWTEEPKTDEDISFWGWSPDPEASEPDYDFELTGDMDLYAVWARTYTVTFHANHPNGWLVVWDEETQEYNRKTDTYSVEFREGEDVYLRYPNRVESDDDSISYWFWSTDPDASEPDYGITATGDMDLYAVWRKAYTVTFHANRADAWFETWDDEKEEYVKEDTRIQICSVGSSIYRDYENVIRTSGNRVFQGWSTNPNAAEAQTSSITVSGNLDLYAIWTEGFDVTFHANQENARFRVWDDEAGEYKTLETYTKKYAIGSTIYEDVWPDTDEKLFFQGWSENPQATVSEEVIMVTGDMDLYAVWAPPCTVTFHVNRDNAWFSIWDDTAGTIVEKETYTKEYALGSYIEEYTYPRPQSDGSVVFRGWSVNPDAADVKCDVRVSGDIDVYAVWSPMITVTFHANHPDAWYNVWDPETESNVKKDTDTRQLSRGVSYSGSYYKPEQDDESTVLIGWATKPDASEPDIGMELTLNDETDLYAVWGKACKVTYHVNHPDAFYRIWDNDASTYLIKDSAEGIYAEGDLIHFEDRHRYLFYSGEFTPLNNDDTLYCIGFSTDPNAAKPQKITVTGDMDLYAVWGKKVNVDYRANGGYFHYAEGSHTSRMRQTYGKGENFYVLSCYPPDENYSFTGWYDAPEGGKKYTEDSVVTGDLTVYAHWTADTGNDISAATVAEIPAQTFTGKEVKPAVKVTFQGKTLQAGKEYTVTYRNNKEPGIGEAVISGKGGYTGSTSKEFLIQFGDVTNPDEFFYDPIYWAVEEGITTGWADGTFRPTNTCNRAAVVTFLWRMAGEPEPSGAAAFSDMTGNSDFDKAISWAVEEGITTGWADNTFRPWNTCNRAAIVTFLWRYAGKPTGAPKATFKDMTGNAEFDAAISWASSQGITTGYSDNTFRPWNTCNRLAVVSFLYRYAGA